MELFIINTYLSLLIFNPLEAAVLFLAATGDFRQVFSKRFIKHWFILGSINFVFQSLVKIFSASFLYLFYSYFDSIFIMGMTLYLYNKFVINKKYNIKLCIFSATFNLITILLIVMMAGNIFNNFIVISNLKIIEEIVINFTIKIFQILLLYIFYKGVPMYEKVFKEHVEEKF